MIDICSRDFCPLAMRVVQGRIDIRIKARRARVRRPNLDLKVMRGRFTARPSAKPCRDEGGNRKAKAELGSVHAGACSHQAGDARISSAAAHERRRIFGGIGATLERVLSPASEYRQLLGGTLAACFSKI